MRVLMLLVSCRVVLCFAGYINYPPPHPPYPPGTMLWVSFFASHIGHLPYPPAHPPGTMLWVSCFASYIGLPPHPPHPPPTHPPHAPHTNPLPAQPTAQVPKQRSPAQQKHTNTKADLQFPNNSGLDNAGKTTIVKSIMGEDIGSVSPTLGFIIRTVEFEG